jgi:peptide/nickel transport system substrate-binding protein
MRSIGGRKWRLLALAVVSGLVLAGCDIGAGDDEAGPGDGAEAEGGGEFASYQTGIFEDTTTDNFWAYYDPESSVWNAYALAPTKASLFDVTQPIKEGLEGGGVIVPDLADGEPAEPAQEGGRWVVEQTIRSDATWSDGEPITAQDFAFTFETVRELELGGNWLSALGEPTGVESIEAVDDTTVRITFADEPGLAIWPNEVGLAPWMPEHFWQDVVTEAKASEDPAKALYAASGVGDPSSGPIVFDAREEGAFARTKANEEFFQSGTQVQIYTGGGVQAGDETYGGQTQGEVGEQYTFGPYFDTETLSLYGDQNAAVLALRQGEVDFLFNPLGMQRGLQDQVVQDPELQSVVNPTYGFRYLAFNLRKPPMSNQAFRRALATIIDREFMAQNVLQGVAFPLYTMMPEGNAAWYDEKRAQEIAEQFQFENEQARLEAAVKILKDAGFTWRREPTYDADEGFVVDGQGLRMPNGNPVAPLEILAPPAGYDPLRATYSIWIEQWASQLGIPAKANPTGFNIIIDKVYAKQPDFDLFILGWSLGNPAYPTYYHSFWHSSQDSVTAGGNNAPGFKSERFDQLADEFMSTRDREEAFDLVWQMEEILAEELPYVVLFDTPILEFYRSQSIAYPFERTLGGIQFVNGMPGLVEAAR